MPEDISEQHLLALIDRYNKDDSIHGILVQLPLPKHIDDNKVLMAIDPDKDVDGFHPVNAGRLLIGGDNVRFRRARRPASMELIIRSGVETKGAELVVVGRSNIVGKPSRGDDAGEGGRRQRDGHRGAHRDARHRRALPRADILIVAAGVPDLVKPEWIKPGACVIDVGVNRVGEKISEKTGKKIAVLRGDVDFEKAVGGRRLDHAGSGGRGADDDRDVDAEHAAVVEVQAGVGRRQVGQGAREGAKKAKGARPE